MSVKEPQILWFLNNDNIAKQEGTYSYVFDPDRMSIDVDGVLTIHQINRSDAGTYKCSVRITDDDPFSHFFVANISVLYLDPPTTNNFQTKFVYGDALEIVCTSGEAYPEPFLVIYKNDNKVASTKGIQLKYSTNVTFNEAGKYYCGASNEVGNKHSPETQLSVNYKDCDPKWYLNSTFEGRKLRLQCHGSVSNKEETYTLLKDDGVVGKGYYYIDKVTEDNVGYYYCVATVKGSMMCSNLTVTYAYVEKMNCDKENIICIAKGNPLPNVTIFENNKVLSSGAGTSIVLLSSSNSEENISCFVNNGLMNDTYYFKGCKGKGIEMIQVFVLGVAAVLFILGIAFCCYKFVNLKKYYQKFTQKRDTNPTIRRENYAMGNESYYITIPSNDPQTDVKINVL